MVIAFARFPCRTLAKRKQGDLMLEAFKVASENVRITHQDWGGCVVQRPVLTF